MAAAHTSQRLTEHARTHAHGQEEDSEEEGIHRGAIVAPRKEGRQDGCQEGGPQGRAEAERRSGGEGAAKAGKFVYFFGAGKADGNRTMKDTLGGKGANLAEMTNAGLPVPPGFTISTDACRAYYAEGRKVPAAVETQMLENVKKLEKAVGNKLGDVEEAAARVGALGREVLDAGHDGHHPEPRPQRPDRREPEGADRQRPLRLRQLPPLHPDVRRRRPRDSEGRLRARVRGGQARARRQGRHRPRRGRPAGDRRPLQEARQGEERQAVPAGSAGADARRA